MHAKLRWGRVLENGHTEDRGYGRITLRWIVVKYVVMTGGG